jgi:GT2 family glycosyltransferase
MHYNPVTMAQVSIIIVNWDGKHLLERCLPAVVNQSFDNYEVVLLDNGSTDGSTEWVEAHFPSVKLIRSEQNLGFARGNNEAIQATRSEYVATLNNDAEPTHDWLAELVQAIESSPTVGMCASKMVRADDPTIIDACGIEMDRAGIGWNRYNGELERLDETSPYEVFGPCAGAALYRREMLSQVGLFDEDYFACYEDVDLAWRAQRAGWRCLYVPAARVVHRHSSTLREGSSFKGYLLGRNKIWTSIKNYPWPNWLLNLPIILGYDVAAWGYALLRGDTGPLRGRMAACKALRRYLKKRRMTQSAGKKVWLCRPKNPLQMLRKQKRLQQLSMPGD